jgi:hypothetical protein
MKCLLVLYCHGFPEDISSPTERTLCSWLFYLCSGKGWANPCICTFHMTGIWWQRNSYRWQFPSHKHSNRVTWSDYNNARKRLALTEMILLIKSVYFLVNIRLLYTREYETHPSVIIKLYVYACMCVRVCVCHKYVISTDTYISLSFGRRAWSQYRLDTRILFRAL